MFCLAFSLRSDARHTKVANGDLLPTALALTHEARATPLEPDALRHIAARQPWGPGHERQFQGCCSTLVAVQAGSERNASTRWVRHDIITRCLAIPRCQRGHDPAAQGTKLPFGHECTPLKSSEWPMTSACGSPRPPHALVSLRDWPAHVCAGCGDRPCVSARARPRCRRASSSDLACSVPDASQREPKPHFRRPVTSLCVCAGTPGAVRTAHTVSSSWRSRAPWASSACKASRCWGPW